MIGGKWKLMLAWLPLDGTRRFGAFRRQVPEITQKVLIRQSRDGGRRRRAPRGGPGGVPSRVDCSPTSFGQSLQALVGAVEGWDFSHIGRLTALKQCRPAAKAHAAAVG